MKTLFLMRHAKADRPPGTVDFDRPLTKRGRKQAKKMAKRLRSGWGRIDAVITSPAVRALETAEIAATQLGQAEKAIQREEAAYDDAGPGALLEIARGIDDSCDSALICGHNPGLNDLAENLAADFEGFLATSAILGIRFPCSSWKELKPGDGAVAYFDYPKRERDAGRSRREELEAAVVRVVERVFPDLDDATVKAVRTEARKVAELERRREAK